MKQFALLNGKPTRVPKFGMVRLLGLLLGLHEVTEDVDGQGEHDGRILLR